MTKNKFKKAFTLVEMAIVLVIIGLVVSSVMVGQSLVRSAAIRATIAQIDSVRSAENAFYSKYNGVAGDLLCTAASSFGLPYVITNGTCTTNSGDGDGALNASNTSIQNGENLLFWLQLKSAGFIQGGFEGITFTSGTSTGPALTTINTAFLTSKLTDSAYVIVHSSAYKNYIAFYGITGHTNGVLATVGTISPIELYQLDKKIDDGLPATGSIQARGGTVVGGSVGGGCATATEYVLTSSATSTCAARVGLDMG